MDNNHWRCLNDSMWSQVPAVQVMAWRLLSKLSANGETWAQDLLDMLYLDDEPVSFCLVLDTGPIRYQLINGYSKSVRQHSTGHILFKEMIFDAIETGVERICFGQGDPGHKGEWGAKPSVELIDLIAIKPGLFSKLASVACSITNGARQMLRAAKRLT